MSHFAQVIDGIVCDVLVAEQDFIDTLPDPQNWIQTSYNTRGGIHYNPETGQPDGGIALRGNYADIGGVYDAEHDVFYTQRPLDMNKMLCLSWTIGAPDWTWKPPIPMPPTEEDGYIITYLWDEALQSWNQETRVRAPLTTGTQTL